MPPYPQVIVCVNIRCPYVKKQENHLPDCITSCAKMNYAGRRI